MDPALKKINRSDILIVYCTNFSTYKSLWIFYEVGSLKILCFFSLSHAIFWLPIFKCHIWVLCCCCCCFWLWWCVVKLLLLYYSILSTVDPIKMRHRWPSGSINWCSILSGICKLEPADFIKVRVACCSIHSG